MNSNLLKIFNEKLTDEEKQWYQVLAGYLISRGRTAELSAAALIEELVNNGFIGKGADKNQIVDEVIRSEGIKNDWLALLQEWSSQVFPDRFGKGISQEKQEWENSIQKAFSLSTLERV